MEGKKLKITPGKWEPVGDSVFVGENLVSVAFDGITPDGDPMDNDVCKANARLIASAPELLRIVEKTIEVRNTQKEYFRTRNQSSLRDSKRLEKELDDLINEYQSDNLPKQQNLF